MASELSILPSSNIYASDSDPITFTYKNVSYDNNIQVRFSYDTDFIDHYYKSKFLNIEKPPQNNKN